MGELACREGPYLRSVKQNREHKRTVDPYAYYDRDGGGASESAIFHVLCYPRAYFLIEGASVLEDDPEVFELGHLANGNTGVGCQTRRGLRVRLPSYAGAGHPWLHFGQA